MKIFFKLLPIFFSMTLMLLSGCSDGNDGFETPPPATQAPPTGIADQNSFTLARTEVAVEGANLAGVETEVTVYAADRHNHPVPDDTVIQFLTNGGAIENQCTIESGSCTVVWNSQDPRPASGYATIIAYTTGEESFLDLNDNDAYDAGETFTDLSEPFIDEIDNGVFDVGLEEFVDRDADNTFDPGDGLYTGDSCVGDNTVCSRQKLWVWGETTIVMSTSWANVEFYIAGVPEVTYATSTDAITPIVIVVTDLNGNQMAYGTTVDVEVGDGTVDSSSFEVVNGSFNFLVNYTAPSTSGNDSLKVTVTSPVSNAQTVFSLPISY